MQVSYSQLPVWLLPLSGQTFDMLSHIFQLRHLRTYNHGANKPDPIFDGVKGTSGCVPPLKNTGKLPDEVVRIPTP